MPILAPETYIGSPFGLDRYVGNLFAVLIEHSYTIASEVNISLVVDGHAIRPHGGKQFPIGQYAIFINTVHIRFAVANICDI